MQIAQRSILIIGFLFILNFLITFYYFEKEAAFSENWTTIQTEYFMNKLCRTGQCSEHDYLLFSEAIGRGGNLSEICIEEYRLEWDLEKKRYYSMVSWEEIKTYLFEENKYVFSDNSIVLVELSQQGRILNKKKKKFGWVTGEISNGT